MWKKTLRMILFAIIGVYVFLKIQDIMIPVMDYDNSCAETYVVKDFYSLEENELDVIFMGTSHVAYGISPMELYEKKNIVSYNLISSRQPVEISYFMLKEIFRTQSPKVVVLDVSDFFEKPYTSDVHYRKILDNMKFGKEKICAAIEYAKMVEDKKTQRERFISVLVPMMQYHSRWQELEQKDFEYENINHMVYVTRGYALSTCVGSGAIEEEQIDEYTEYDKQDSFWFESYAEGTFAENCGTDEGYSPEVRDGAEIWLKKIEKICSENGADLLLTKIPVRSDNMTYVGAWDEFKYQRMKQVASKNNITYLDLTYDVDLKIDVATDYHDEGYHLNYRGATKVSDYMATYLCDHYDLEPNQSEDMDFDRAIYDCMREMAVLQTENDFPQYCELLNDGKEMYIVCMVTKGDFREFLSEGNVAALQSLGMRTDFKQSIEIRNAYAALINGGEVDYEVIGNRNIVASRNVSEGQAAVLISPGNCASSIAEVRANGRNLAKTGNGLHVVVLDKETNALIDSAVFDINGKKVHDDIVEERQRLTEYMDMIKFM